MDRAGVSKGYGLVTFETEEEAKRLYNAINDKVCVWFMLSSKANYTFLSVAFVTLFRQCRAYPKMFVMIASMISHPLLYMVRGELLILIVIKGPVRPEVVCTCMLSN